MISAPLTNFVHIKQVKQWPELGHFTLQDLKVCNVANFQSPTVTLTSTRRWPMLNLSQLFPNTLVQEIQFSSFFNYHFSIIMYPPPHTHILTDKWT